MGRDKILRTLQYFPRFYAWYLYRTNRPQSSIDPYNAVKKQFGTTRKILRIGKFAEHLKAAAVAADNKSPIDPVLRYLAVGRQLGYAGYLTLDTITVIDIIGFRKIAAVKRLQDTAYRSWLAGLIFSAIASAYSLWRLREKERTLDRTEGEGVVEAKKLEKFVHLQHYGILYSVANPSLPRERSAARTQLFSDLCDMTIPVSALGLANLDDGIVGIGGTVSSLLGVVSQWRKTA